jgi:hypothetical protein
MTEVAGSPVTDLNNNRLHLFKLVSPPAGAQTVVVTLSVAHRFLAASMTCLGSVGFGTPSTLAVASTHPTIVIAATSNDLVMDCLSVGNTGATSDKTSRYDVQYGETGVEMRARGSTAVGAASVTMGYVLVANSELSMIAMAVLGGTPNEVQMIVNEGG